MKYKKLQDKAKELGLKYVGVSADNLEKAIKEAENKKAATSNEEAPKKSKKVEDRDAVVYNGKHRVRTYTLERHGENYVQLAKQYISHPEREEYRIEFETVETRITCPHCGKKFRI